MRDLLERVEDKRLASGLSQRAVARELSISQPHYSKVVGGVAQLTPAIADAMAAWLGKAGPVSTLPDEQASRIRALTRSIERTLRELNSLLAEGGVRGRKRGSRRTRRRNVS